MITRAFRQKFFGIGIVRGYAQTLDPKQGIMTVRSVQARIYLRILSGAQLNRL